VLLVLVLPLPLLLLLFAVVAHGWRLLVLAGTMHCCEYYY
jgi:hypothetical protein